MPRRPRSLVAGGVYHVTSRGVRRSPIFVDDADRLRFLRLLVRVVDRHGWQPLTWCLMTTHYHLLVLTPEPDLAEGMQRLNSDHATYLNGRHRTSGHVFQGRYGAEPVLSDQHLLSTVRYIALNPVKAGLCADPAAWRWSGHRALLGLEAPTALDRGATLERFEASGGTGRDRYAEFVGSSTPRRPSPPAEALVGPPRALNDALGRPDDAETIARAYFEEGYSLREVADALGLARSTVRRRLNTANRV